MALNPQVVAAIDRAATAIVAANPEQDRASWVKTLTGYATDLPGPGTYARAKLAWLVNGGLGRRTLKDWSVADADVTRLKNLWGV